MTFDYLDACAVERSRERHGPECRPSQSPDLNLIEHLCVILGGCVRQHSSLPSSEHQMWGYLLKEWVNIPSVGFQRLVGSMPRHIEAAVVDQQLSSMQLTVVPLLCFTSDRTLNNI